MLPKAHTLYYAVIERYPKEGKKGWDHDRAESWIEWAEGYNSWDQIWNSWGEDLKSGGNFRMYIAKTAWAIHTGIYNTKLYKSLA